MKPIILASKSPRRIKILKDLKIPFKCVPSMYKEKKYNKNKFTPEEYVLHNARGKARDSAKRAKKGIVVGMDTVGAIDGMVLGKPKDRKHAREMIKMLRGKTHSVITGICIYDIETKKELSAAEATRVTFADMTDMEIEMYLDLGMWKDFACAYAVQEKGAFLIEHIDGDYFNIVGFPVFRFGRLMKEFGISLLEF